jgi:hypothetical protein
LAFLDETEIDTRQFARVIAGALTAARFAVVYF